MFQLKFAVLTPALTAGGFIERIRFGPFLAYMVLPWLLPRGMHDHQLNVSNDWFRWMNDSSHSQRHWLMLFA